MAYANNQLRVPCCYQGGKQRVSKEIVEVMLDGRFCIDANTRFYDLCCGSGAISIELINRGITPQNIIMLDKSSWGAFWKAIGSGSFDIQVFRALIEGIPADKKHIKQYMIDLAREPIGENEAYIYPILQACSFGGKQIWRNNEQWENAFFRDYWEPTETSVRRSPANPMQPSAETLFDRVNALALQCRGLSCIHEDIDAILDEDVSDNSIVYIDPPYRNTTGYGFSFDVDLLVESLRERTTAPILVSEGTPISSCSIQLLFGGAKGGISGVKSGKHQEWLSLFL